MLKDQFQERYDQFIVYLMPMVYLGIITTIGSMLYFLWKFTLSEIRKKQFAYLYISSQDPLFNFVLEYLTEKGLMNETISHIKAGLQKKKQKFWFITENVLDKAQISFLPSSGNYTGFYYEGKKVFVTQQFIKETTVGWDKTPETLENINFYVYGAQNITILQKIIEDAIKYSANKDKGKTNIYAQHRWYSIWEKQQNKEPRSFESVILDKGIGEEILNDLQSFLNNKQWYDERNIPYRRGYLLYGPPGTGKTSFILAIAAKLKLSLCTLNLSGSGLDDDELNRLLESTPQNSIVLLEDVDAIFVERTSLQEKRQGKTVSFSGLLNALDGIRSVDGRILFMTTNHKEKLDPALLRPGRADVHVKLDNASGQQIYQLFVRFFQDHPKVEQLAAKFQSLLPEYKIGMAKLQGHLLRNKTNPEQAVETALNLVDQKKYKKLMTVYEWLYRLNMHQYADAFHKDDIYNVSDLENISEGNLETYGVKLAGHKLRIMNMIKGHDETKSGFQFLTKNKIRGFLNIYYENQPELVNYITDLIPEESVTEFQLKDLIDKIILKKYGKKCLVREIKELVRQNQNVNEGHRPKIETMEEKQKKVQFSIDPKKILEDLGFKQEAVKKFVEENAIDVDVFLNLKEQDIQRTFGVTNYGLFNKLKDKIKNLNDEKKKLVEQLDDECNQEDEKDDVINEDLAKLNTFRKKSKEKTIQF